MCHFKTFYQCYSFLQLVSLNTFTVSDIDYFITNETGVYVTSKLSRECSRTIYQFCCIFLYLTFLFSFILCIFLIYSHWSHDKTNVVCCLTRH